MKIHRPEPFQRASIELDDGTLREETDAEYRNHLKTNKLLCIYCGQAPAIEPGYHGPWCASCRHFHLYESDVFRTDYTSSREAELTRALSDIIVECAPDINGSYNYEKQCWEVEQIALIALGSYSRYIPWPGPRASVEQKQQSTSETPDNKCITLPDGGCVGKECMHDPKLSLTGKATSVFENSLCACSSLPEPHVIASNERCVYYFEVYKKSQ